MHMSSCALAAARGTFCLVWSATTFAPNSNSLVAQRQYLTDQSGVIYGSTTQ
jgi:hypothetical protein